MKPDVDRPPFYNKVIAYNEFSCEHSHAMQISFQRSGRVWLSTLLEQITQATVWNLEMSAMSPEGFSEECAEYIFHSHLYEYLELQPDIKYLFIIRDPRDAFCSWVEFGAQYNDKLTLWDEWENFEDMIDLWRSYFDRLLSYDTLVVQYEQLCLHPKKVLSKICNHIGKEIKQDIMDAVTAFDKYHCGYQYNEFGDKNKHSTGRDRYDHHCLKWQSHPKFTEGHNNFVWASLKDIMVHYGYLKDGHGKVLFTR